MIKLDDIDVTVLEYFIHYITLTSYKFSKDTGIPSATAWRVFNRLSEFGLIKKDEKGFTITARGVVIAFLNTKKEIIRKRALSLLKKLWKYEGEEEDLRYFINDLCDLLKSLNISPFAICFNQPITVATMLYNNIDNLSERTKKVIASIFLNFFPSTELGNGCKLIVSFDNEGKPYAIAANCKKEGIRLNYRCPELMEKFLGRSNDVVLRRVY